MIAQHKANRLIHATSPYLLQHAHNPVDWFEWNEEALTKAKQEDKPILVSIGYSSCHWCHVMERESFEKENIARVMNAHFVCIKVDREERPDVDQIYMDAVQALGIQGGWPLNVFLTPDQKPFFGGTYFSPQVWVQVLNNINNAFKDNREQIEETAEQLRLHLLRSDANQFKQIPVNSELVSDVHQIFSKLSSRFDKEWGGMDKAPKFIMPSVWLWLLRYHHLSKNQEALQQVALTLKRVARGGIYDQIGGGFSRYSVDAYWFAPHFEKMLYDNAQLMSLYSEAYAITKDEEFKTIVYETFEWLQREMTSEQGGFYSALDADSEGVEGKYYVWTSAEIAEHLQKDAALVALYYGVTPEGNWEHGNNILVRNKSNDEFLKEHILSLKAWSDILKKAKTKLLQVRNQRVKPGLDDKIITAWNAMMIIGLTDAYKAFSDTRFYKAAVRNMQFLENEVMEGTLLYRSYKGKRSDIKAFLDDYAYLIQAQIKLYQVSFDEYWINRAETFMRYVVEHFYDSNDGFFHYSLEGSNKLIARKKEIFDNVIPSSNALIAQNLNYLSILLDNNEWRQISEHMTFSLGHLVKSEPNYMSQWAIVYTELKKGLAEIVFVGNQAEEYLKAFNMLYQPHALTMGTKTKSNLPLVKDKKPIEGTTTIYVCYNKTCKLPVSSIADAVNLLT